jgi:hypothetical protein
MVVYDTKPQRGGIVEYYICHKGYKLMGPMGREDAIKQLFELKGTFEGIYIQIVDKKSGKIIGEIPKRKKN